MKFLLAVMVLALLVIQGCKPPQSKTDKTETAPVEQAPAASDAVDQATIVIDSVKTELDQSVDALDNLLNDLE